MSKKYSFARLLLLHLTAILFVVLNVSDIKIGGLSSVIPLFDLMIIFYFTIFKNVFSTWFIFLLGIWNDALNGNPLGTTSLCYILLIKLFMLSNNKLFIRENFTQILEQFAVFCFLFLLLKWMMLSALNGAFYSVTTAMIQLVLSSIFYVAIHKFCDYLSNKLLDA